MYYFKGGVMDIKGMLLKIGPKLFGILKGNFKLMVTVKETIHKYRLKLIELLIGDLKVVANLKITSDIVTYNDGIDFMSNVNIKPVSSKQSFVFNPNNVK